MPAPEPGTAGGNTRPWAVLAVMCLALLMVGIDGTVVNVALPTLVRSLGASNTQLQWIEDAYTILFAGLLLVAGSTGDRLGRKRCFTLGLTVFVVGSMLCSTATTATTLIILRGVQGLGAAFVMPATLSIITNVFSDATSRAKAIALWSGVSGLGVAVGPLVGGYLLGHFWWGSIFLVNVPLGIITILAALVVVPESRDTNAPRLDVVGTMLSTTGLITLLFSIIEGPTRGWTSPVIVAAFAGGLVLLAAFVAWEHRTDHPILDLSFFRNSRFTAASISVTLIFFAMFGSLFFISQYLQFVLGYSALESGAKLIPVAAVMMIAAPSSARIVARIGTKAVVTTGLTLVALSLLLFSQTTVASGYGHILVVLIGLGLGMGLAMAPATDSIMGSLPANKAGVGSAMNDTTREIGGALGVAILGSIATAAYSASVVASPHYAAVANTSPAAAAALKSSVGAASVVATRLPADARQTIVDLANHAFVDGLDRAVLIGAIFALLGAAVAFFFLPARAERTAQSVDALVEEGVERLSSDPEQRRTLAAATLQLVAERGMAGLTYAAVAARSGVATSTLERMWSTRVDAVSDAVDELLGDNAFESIRSGTAHVDTTTPRTS